MTQSLAANKVYRLSFRIVRKASQSSPRRLLERNKLLLATAARTTRGSLISLPFYDCILGIEMSVQNRQRGRRRDSGSHWRVWDPHGSFRGQLLLMDALLKFRVISSWPWRRPITTRIGGSKILKPIAGPFHLSKRMGSNKQKSRPKSCRAGLAATQLSQFDDDLSLSSVWLKLCTSLKNTIAWLPVLLIKRKLRVWRAELERVETLYHPGPEKADFLQWPRPQHCSGSRNSRPVTPRYIDVLDVAKKRL